MSEQARRNGWKGFDVAERVHGGYRYICDGMPSMMGCGVDVIVPRKWTRTGEKKSGWLVVYGLEPKPGTPGRFDNPEEWEEDHDVVLTFCPRCAAIVRDQDAARGLTRPDTALNPDSPIGIRP